MSAPRMDAGSRAPQEFLGLPSPAAIRIREEGPRPWAGRRADGGRGRRKGKGASRNLRRGRACGGKRRKGAPSLVRPSTRSARC